MRHSRTHLQSLSRRGFSLIEILIVVMILGIIASVVIPQFTNASQEARENALKDDLRYLRTQIEVYSAQHGDVPPGYPNGNLADTPTEEALVAQLTQRTNRAGQTSATPDPTYPFGPYFDRFPTNAINGKWSVRMQLTDEDPSIDGNSGWIYIVPKRRIVANALGVDSSGTPYANY